MLIPFLIIGLIFLNIFFSFTASKSTKDEPKKRSVTTFLVFTWTLTAWQANLYLSNIELSDSIDLFLNRLVFLWPALSALLIQMYVYFETSSKIKRASLPHFAPSILSIIFSLSPLVVISIIARTGGDADFTGYNVETGPLYIPYVATLVFSIILAIVNLIRAYRKNLSDQGLKTLALGLLSLALFGIIFNVFIPIYFDTSEFGELSIIGIALFVGFTSYGIVIHKLFDIKTVVARSLTYSLSLLTLLAIFVVFVVTVGNFLTEGSLTTAELVTFFILSLGMVVLAPILRNFFDQLTRKIFFRDSYESEAVLNKLSDLIVREIELSKIIGGSEEILSDTLKPQQLYFSLLGDDMSEYAAGLSSVKRLSTSTIKLLDESGETVIIADNLLHKDSLKTELRSKDIALIHKLKAGESSVGFLVLGDKKSGTGFTSQDQQLINVAGNELALAIQNARSFEEIKAFNTTLTKEVERATRNLKKSNAKLKALDEAKDEFISMASHQLRTPLTSIKGYLSMVLEGDAGEVEPAQERMLEEAFTSSQRMVYLIADLLNVSRLKTGKFMIERSVVDLPKVVKSELSQLDEMLKARKLKIKIKVDKNFPKELLLDETKTRQVLMNFVDNAIYYTPTGGNITVELTHNSRSIKCEVTDTGIGVSPDEQKHLFTKFFRATNARKARPDGTGLGLFMAQKVVSAQEGAVIFRSKLGKGSTFGFTFPMSSVKVTKKKPIIPGK